MEQFCHLDLFGIQVKYRPDWRIIPDQAYNLNYESGLFRFEENIAEKRSRVSMGVRWECSQTDSETFLREFREGIHKEYQKALKGKGRQFQLLRDDVIERSDGSKLCLVETKYRASQALVPNPKKMQRLQVCNAAYYCEKSHRMIICSVVTTPEYMEENRALLEELMTSVQSRSVYSTEEESARMDKRAKARAEAARRNQGPMAALGQRLKDRSARRAAANTAQSGQSVSSAQQ